MNRLPLALLRSYKLCYIASPYSLHPRGREAACAEVCEVAGELVNEGVKVFSPIAHSHTLCQHSDCLDPLDHEGWMEQDEAFMNACDCLVIVELPSWENSLGIAMEADYFRRQGKPVHRLNPITMELR